MAASLTCSFSKHSSIPCELGYLIKMVKRSQSVPCTEILLVLSGIQVDQLQKAIIHFMAEAGLSLMEGFLWTFKRDSSLLGSSTADWIRYL